MKTVRLPIFDENGLQLLQELQVSVELFEKLASSSVIYKDHVKVVRFDVPETYKEIEAALTPQEEIDLVDRIIHDLPPLDWWRNIPGFEGYKMSPKQMIVDRETGKTVAQGTNGRARRVILFDKDSNRARTFDVNYLFKKTFPELT